MNFSDEWFMLPNNATSTSVLRLTWAGERSRLSAAPRGSAASAVGRLRLTRMVGGRKPEGRIERRHIVNDVYHVIIVVNWFVTCWMFGQFVLGPVVGPWLEERGYLDRFLS
ncbi:MAG: hypothetical protein NVSMB52_03510 [Chloroflexota bacterium]